MTLKEQLDVISVKIQNKEQMSQEEKDLMTFAISTEFIKEEMKSAEGLSDELRCVSKLNWIKNEFLEKYPKYSEEVNEILKTHINV